MVESIIHWSVKHRAFVLFFTIFIALFGVYAIKNTPVDAIPDLSDVQVIVKTSFPGQAPQVVEDQITYPISNAMLSVPGAQTVRGFSFFGDSYVYVIFDDQTDIYWARSRVLEYLNQVTGQLPETAKPTLGPDATGVGWIFAYALKDETGQQDLSQLRSVQDYFLKLELQTVQGVSEIATLGGMVKQYQVEVDPVKLVAYQIPLAHIQESIQRANQEIGASVIEMAEAEYMITASGYIQSLKDLSAVPLGISREGTPVLLKDVARIYEGPMMRRGIAELNGQGEVVGGIVVMRYGENAQQTIERVKDKLAQLKLSLPAGVELVTVYDRSDLIERAVANLWEKLAEEFLIVALVCVIFLAHFRSSLVAIISLPIGILTAFIVIYFQGLNANIMSLGGIAIAIGAMVDGAIVMIENMHKHLEKEKLTPNNRWQIVTQSACEVGPALFFSLLIITVSFLPVFTLEAQEGRLFSPLAYTKTYAMAAAAALAVTLVPVLMGYCIRGKIKPEASNPINRMLLNSYRPILSKALERPKTVLVLMFIVLLGGVWPLSKIGSEFMPPLDEGDLMYMPTTHPGISVGKARQILQQTDKLISTLPEVNNVFGKIGRAETATDPAPLTMIETFIQLKPKSQWREGMTTELLIKELEQRVNLPGISNAWVMPIKTRIDMLATGIKTPVGIKVAGPELSEIDKIGRQIETILNRLDGTASVYAERVAGGRYLHIDIKREEAARYGLNIADVHQMIETSVGGRTIGESVEGLARYPINMRYPQSYRYAPEALANLPLITKSGLQLALGDVATIKIKDGPPSLKSENARLNGWIFVDIENIDLGRYVAAAKKALQSELVLPAGYAINWSGQFEYLLRAEEKLKVVVPFTIAIIALLLYFNFRNFSEVLIVLTTLPLALVGGVWLMYWQDYNFSVAVAVGFIALAGVAIEIGVMMLVYINQVFKQHSGTIDSGDPKALTHIILQGAGMRIRPVMMTSVSIIFGLLPVLYGSGTGSEVMSRIAAPMVGGMISALLLTLIVIPVIYLLWKRYQLTRQSVTIG